MLFSCCSYKPTVPQFDVNSGFMLETSNEADFRHPLSGATHGTGSEWSSSLRVCVLNTFFVAVEKLYAFLAPGNHVDGRAVIWTNNRVKLLSLLNVMSSGTTWWQAAFTVSIDFILCCSSAPGDSFLLVSSLNPHKPIQVHSGDQLLSASSPNILIKIIRFINPHE